MFEQSGRFDGVEFSTIRKLLELAPEDAINFGIGQPDYLPPEHVQNAMKEAVDRGQFSYPHTMGMPKLRENIANDYNQKYGLDLTSKNVLITVGATEGISCALSSCTNPGDKVLITDPTFNVMYEGQCKKLGLEILRFTLDKENNHSMDLTAFEAFVKENKPNVAIPNFPSNPTGRVEPPKKFQEIFRILEDNGIPSISDEVYSELIYDVKFETALKDSHNVIVVDSFSKRLGMCGCRVGYAITPHEILETMTMDHMYRVAGVDKIAQTGVQAAYEQPKKTKKFLDDIRKDYKERRDVMVSGLKKIGIETYTPDGAFYLFPSIENHAPNSAEFVAQMMKRGVIVTPGYAFGPAGKDSVRISYARSMEEINEGLERMEIGMSSF